MPKIRLQRSTCRHAAPLGPGRDHHPGTAEKMQPSIALLRTELAQRAVRRRSRSVIAIWRGLGCRIAPPTCRTGRLSEANS
jgi:hypothetical protein